MGHVLLDSNTDNVVASYSQVRGPVLRSEKVELTKIHLRKGEGADLHQHPEEQVVYLLSGALEATVDDEVYTVKPGEASFHPSNSMHRVIALEDSVGLSFKNLVDPKYQSTGNL